MMKNIKCSCAIGQLIVLMACWLVVSCEESTQVISQQELGSQPKGQTLELNSLIVNGSEVFVKEALHVSEYVLFVEADVEEIKLFASFTNMAKMVINGMESSGKETLALKYGANHFLIQIKSASEMRGYQLVVMRKSS